VRNGASQSRRNITPVPAERKRKSPTAKQRLEVFERDNYTCVICGRSRITSPGLALEVDHVEPYSKGGADALDNYQTLCQRCNRGKGDNAELNKALAAEIDALLDDINPEIRQQLRVVSPVPVVANQEDFARLARANDDHDPPRYRIEPTRDSIHGYQAMFSSGIYTVRDNYGAKVRFYIAPA
jgi:hypothetical protein